MTPVDVRGTIYRSITAAAIGEGVSITTVQKHLDRGTPELIGIKPQTKRKALLLDGKYYPSQVAAAAALGVSHQAISNRVKSQRTKA